MIERSGTRLTSNALAPHPYICLASMDGAAAAAAAADKGVRRQDSLVGKILSSAAITHGDSRA